MYIHICVCMYAHIYIYIARGGETGLASHSNEQTCSSSFWWVFNTLFTYMDMCICVYACVYIHIYIYIARGGETGLASHPKVQICSSSFWWAFNTLCNHVCTCICMYIYTCIGLTQCWYWIRTIESIIGPNGGFGWTPRELLTISKPNPSPKSETRPARKWFSKSNLWNLRGKFDGRILSNLYSNQHSLCFSYFARRRIFRSPGPRSTGLQRASCPPACQPDGF